MFVCFFTFLLSAQGTAGVVGIPTAAREKILERFFRLETSRSTPGNGLGLSLVPAIVNLHHGKIELADNLPGLNITITLPRSS
jgi:signal transduction histidine kinase